MAETSRPTTCSSTRAATRARSGPSIGRFLTGLRDGRIVGVRLADGRVLVPPTEYDPTTSDAIAPDGDHWVDARSRAAECSRARGSRSRGRASTR